MKRVLVIEDNQDLAFGLRSNLEIEGYEVQVAATGQDGLNNVAMFAPQLIILDLMLPKMDGFQVLERLRDNGFQTPVLILTARGEEIDKVRGLRLGADDYVTKPFGLMELLARVEAILRRVEHSEYSTNSKNLDVIRIGTIEVCPQTRDVRRDEQSVSLAPKEYELLVELIRNKGAVVSRVALMKSVWGHSSSIVSRTVDTHIAELRRKLESDPSNPKLIITVRKIGYRLNTSFE